MEPLRDLGLHQRRLARRLRALREEHWPDARLTQPTLAASLGRTKPLGATLISSWESQTNPKVPPASRLHAYATFFATRRSVAGGIPRLLDEAELTEDERAARDALKEELLTLRAAAAGQSADETEEPVQHLWRFPDGADVVIVCGELPDDDKSRYAFPDNPDYVELMSYADLDALMELRGHIRAQNPASPVFVRLATALRPDDVSGHIVLLGGMAFNSATTWFTGKLDLPIEQIPGGVDRPDVFASREDPQQRFESTADEHGLVIEDVGLLVRMPNPLNAERTLTVCGGVHTRGVMGAVRLLTDARLRGPNEAYLASRFGEEDSFGLLMRVPVLHARAMTPELRISRNRLLEWPAPR